MGNGPRRLHLARLARRRELGAASGDSARGWARRLVVLTALVVGLAAPPSAEAWWREQGPVFTIIEENDLFVATDRHYTQGLKLSFLHADDAIPGWVARLSDLVPRLGMDAGPGRLGYHLGQSIFTPANLAATEVQMQDRPYAGWLYMGVVLQRRGLLAARWPVVENFELDLGIIGPHSYADETQTRVHEFRGFEVPRGWRHQLRDEPGIALKYQRAWLFSPSPAGPRVLDLIPHAGISLGNVDTSVRIGATVRVGWHLPDDFGVPTISSLATTDGGWSRHRVGRRWGVQAFVGAEVWRVLYTAFLDGNLFRASHRVDKEPVVVESKVGVGLILDRAEFTLSYVYRSPEFAGQRRDHAYGSLALKLQF